MPFKVVQTIENGKICISAVPSGWEVDGTLWWPPKSQSGNICIENSTPKQKWTSYSCVVKRQYNTYKEATAEAERMEAETDTETDEIDTRKEGNASCLFGDFNSMILSNQDNYQIEHIHQPAAAAAQIGENISLSDCNLDTSYIIKTNDHTEEILQNQKIIIDLLKKQAEMSTRIATQLAKHDVSFAEIYKKLNNNTESNNNIYNSNSNNILIEKFPRINTIEELKQLEENLKEPTFKSKYINSMSNLCSKGSNMSGLMLCYRLIDEFIARNVLLQCSWTGNARNNGEHEKIAFKFFENIRYAFFTIINNGDLKFSQIECDQFFKRILKNSKQRLLNSTKASTPKSKKSLKRKISSLQSPTIEESSNENQVQEKIDTNEKEITDTAVQESVKTKDAINRHSVDIEVQKSIDPTENGNDIRIQQKNTEKKDEIGEDNAVQKKTVEKIAIGEKGLGSEIKNNAATEENIKMQDQQRIDKEYAILMLLRETEKNKKRKRKQIKKNKRTVLQTENNNSLPTIFEDNNPK